MCDEELADLSIRVVTVDDSNGAWAYRRIADRNNGFMRIVEHWSRNVAESQLRSVGVDQHQCLKYLHSRAPIRFGAYLK